MKIKINQEAQTSNQLSELLRLKRQQPIIKTHWIILPFIIFGLMYAWQQQFGTAWVIIPILWCVLVINISLLTRSQRARLQKIEQLKIEPIFWNKLRQSHPELTLKQRQLIEVGFKDYLALHVMQKQAYAMPSNAVDALWHVMLEFPQQYQQLCHATLGRILNHNPYHLNTEPEQQQKQLFESWKISCKLHGFEPKHSAVIPRLFVIDQALGWVDGQYFDLDEMSKDYSKYQQAQSSSSCGSSCSSCGGD